MTVRSRSGPAGAGAPAGQYGWAACVPELVAASFLIVGSCLGVYLYGGLGLAAYTAAAWAVLCVVMLPALLPSASVQLIEQERWHGRSRTSFLGFWRKRSQLQDATTSMAVYDADLRPSLQHLLAARLAERHGVNLYADLAAARRLLDAGSHGPSLWVWLDPQRPAATDQRQPGIPQRTLTAIIDRLERL
jgi:hypothetical protein